MGDCLLLTGPVRALKQEFPAFRVSVLVEDRFAACFDGNPDFDEILSVSGKYFTIGRLMFRRFHAVLNLHGGPTSLFYSLSAWGRRIGASHYRYPKLYNGLVPQPDPALHTAQGTLSWFRALGLSAGTSPSLRYEPHAPEAERIRQIMRGRGYVVIHPAASLETKRWAPGRFAQVAKELRQRFTIVLTCGPGEEQTVAAVAREVPDSVLLFGLTIPELAELLRGARLYLGNDGGPMHLAAAVGTPAVVPWGSSDSKRWSPWKVAHRVVQNPFECNPCPGYRCLVDTHPLCIESITVEQVLQAAMGLTP